MESHHLSSERDNSMTKNDSISHNSSQNASAAYPVVFIAGSTPPDSGGEGKNDHQTLAQQTTSPTKCEIEPVKCNVECSSRQTRHTVRLFLWMSFLISLLVYLGARIIINTWCLITRQIPMHPTHSMSMLTIRDSTLAYPMAILENARK